MVCRLPRPVNEITRRDVKDLALKPRRTGGKKGKGHSPKGVWKIIGTLSCILAEAVEDKFIDANPAEKLRKVYRSAEFKDGSSEAAINPLSRDELAHLLSTALTHSRSDRKGARPGVVETCERETVYPFRAHYPFLLCLARSGMRLGEVIGLHWGDLDFRGSFIDVRRAWVKGKVTTPKSRQSRRVYMSDQLRQALEGLRRERLAGKVVAIEEAADAGAYVFGDGAKPVDPDNFRRRVFEPLLKAAKLRKVRLHDFRHGYASLMLQQGEELIFVQEQLGHHSAAFTLKEYGHLMPRDRRGNVNRLDDCPAFALSVRG